MVIYKRNGDSLLGYRTADGEVISSYGWESPAGGDVVYNYVVNGVTKTSSVEPVAIGLDVNDDSYRTADLMSDDIINNHLLGEHEDEFTAMQAYRRYAKETARNVVESIEQQVESSESEV